jgi:hypothetical protein
MAEVFNAAAEKIEREGWWNGKPEDTDKSGTCIWLSVNHIITDVYNGTSTDKQRRRRTAEQAFAEHFGFDPHKPGTLAKIYEANDLGEGKAWAVDTLRQISAKLQERGL